MVGFQLPQSICTVALDHSRVKTPLLGAVSLHTLLSTGSPLHTPYIPAYTTPQAGASNRQVRTELTSSSASPTRSLQYDGVAYAFVTMDEEKE